MASFEEASEVDNQDDVVMAEVLVDGDDDDVDMMGVDDDDDARNIVSIVAADAKSEQQQWPMPSSPSVGFRSLDTVQASVTSSSPSPLSLSLLESLPTDDMNVVLSYLTYYEFRCLAILSTRMNDAVAHTSNLYVNSIPLSSLEVTMRSTSSMQQPYYHRHTRVADSYTPSAVSQVQPPAAAMMAQQQPPVLPTTQSQPKDSLRVLLNKYQSINVLKLQSGCLVGEIGDDIVPILNESPASNKLTSLSLYGCSLSYWCTESFQLHHLQHLTICGGSIRCTRIDQLLQPSAQNLKSLSIGQCSSFRDDTIEQLVQLFRGQNHASINTATSVDPPLPMDHRTNSTFTDDNIGTGHHVAASGMSQLRYSPISVPSHCSLRPTQQPQLQRLILQQCIRIQNPIFDFPSLTHLSLVGCFSLQSFPKFNCPNLQVLDVSFCIRLTSNVIQQAILQSSTSCPKLTSLIMVKCTGVTKLKFYSQSLQHLNISYCNKLTELRMDCPSLQHLENVSCCSLSTFIIDNAYNLTELDFSQNNAMSTSSPVLKRLELRAPNLLHLNLEGCRRLDHCQISCPRLEKVNVRGSRIVALRFCKDIRQVLVKRWALRT